MAITVDMSTLRHTWYETHGAGCKCTDGKAFNLDQNNTCGIVLVYTAGHGEGIFVQLLNTSLIQKHVAEALSLRQQLLLQKRVDDHTMTAWNGNIFHATGHLCREFGEFPVQRPVTRSFGVFVDLPLNKRLGKQWWGWWFQTPSPFQTSM